MVEYILPILISIPIIGALLIFLLPLQYVNFRKDIALWASSICLPISTLLWVLFDRSSGLFQFNVRVPWIPRINIYFSLGIDGISLFFVLLTTFLMPLCFLASWDIIKSKYTRTYFRAFLLIERLILGVFCVTDLFAFYIFFEAVLIPMFLLIGIYGGRERRIKAAYLFFLYTLLGSLLMLLALLLLYFTTGRTDYRVLQDIILRAERERLLWLAFFCRFAVKVPIVPVHLWLPEAHVEAPTAGSVLLAGILLKLGTYGIVRFSLGLFPAASIYFTPLVYTLAVLAIIYTSLTALRQTDIKRVIAYASVAHMNITLVGVFSMTREGLEGAILQMLSHGIVSGALFLCVGVLYDRYHTRLIAYYGGLAHTMPIFVTLFLLFTIANIALPGTSSFVGEFLILIGICQTNTVATVFAITTIVLGGGYSLWLFNRLAYGNLNTQRLALNYFGDLNRREFYCLVPLAFLTLYMGIYPNPFLTPMHMSCDLLLQHVNASVL